MIAVRADQLVHTEPARCLGYVEFRRWFAPEVDQLETLVEEKPAGAVRRLAHPHNTLIELPAGTPGTGRQGG